MGDGAFTWERTGKSPGGVTAGLGKGRGLEAGKVTGTGGRGVLTGAEPRPTVTASRSATNRWAPDETASDRPVTSRRR